MPPSRDESPRTTAELTETDYRQYAGTVVWPRHPSQLTDTSVCPACLTPLTSSTCGNCGLNLAHLLSVELAEVSRQATAVLDRRIELIGQIRFESRPIEDEATVATPPSTPAPAPAEAEAEATPATAAVSAMAPADRATTEVPPTSSRQSDPAVESSAPRRSTVQVALLIAGVSLLSVFAIFFLVYAFINFGIIWRSVIIAGITVAAFVSASLLRRRRLSVSAEGLAVFAIVLIYLDAYALRANDFFGLQSADGAIYWGATLTLTAIGFVFWHRFSRVRAASVVGWATVASGVGVLAWGLGERLEPDTRVFVALGFAALVGLAHALVPHGAFRGTIERMLLLGSAFVALLAGFVTAWVVEADTDWGGTVAVAVVVACGLVLSVSTAAHRHTTRGTRGFSLAFATVTGVAAATALAVTAVRVESHAHTFALVAPVLAATIVALAGELGARKLRMPGREQLGRASAFATGGALGVLGLVVLLPLSLAAEPLATALSNALRYTWGSPAVQLTLTSAGDDSGTAVLTLAGVVALAAASWSLTGRLGWRTPALAWGTSAVLTLIAAQLPNLWFTLAAWFVLATAALGLLLRARALATPAIRACLITGIAVNTTLMFISGWASLDTWAMTTAATIALLLACRMVWRSAGVRATLWAAAVTLLIVGAGAGARHLSWNAEPAALAEVVNVTTLVALISTALLLACALPLRALTLLDRRVTFWITAGVTVSAGASLWGTVGALDPASPGLLLPHPAFSLITSILALAGLVLWVGLRANSPLRAERIVASLAAGPVVYWVVDSFARLIDLAPAAFEVVPVTAALISAAGALTITLLRPTTTPRWTRELGVALIGVPALLTTLAQDAAAGWLVLIIAAVAVLLLAIDRDGLFTSHSARRYLGWGALALATGGLWWRLSAEQVEAVEPYVLPLAAALLVIAVLVEHRQIEHSRAAPLIALAAMLTAILPIAADAISGDLGRAIVITAVSAALLLVGSIGRKSTTLRPYLDAATLAGAIGVLVTPIGRALQAATSGLTPDTWLIAMVVLLLIAAFAQAHACDDATDRWRTIASQALGVVGIVAFATIESVSFTDPTLGTPRALATVALLSVLHVIAYAIDRAPFTRAISWVALGLSALTALIGLTVDALDPIEFGTVPIAIALLVTGSIRMGENSTIRSWLPLGPGIGVLLLPSLLATSSAPELWRLVALGVASVTVLIIGTARRLQAPFLLGLAIALIHGFATFAPQIRAVYESQEWWLWAGIAGVILVLLAVRYEKRIQNLKDVVMRIAALR